MRSTVLAAPGDIRSVELDDPGLQAPTDALVRVRAAGICGSDLWAFTGVAQRAAMQAIGHEFVGEVTAVGAEVRGLRVGDEVAAPFSWSCAECPPCREGWTSSCSDGGFFGRTSGAGGAQSEFVRVPHADGTLLPLPPGTLSDERRTVNVLLAGDVLATGRHAVEIAGVGAGTRCVVVGDGSVGLAAVTMARRAGATHITVLGHHRARMARAGEADRVVDSRSTGWFDDLVRSRPDAVLDCVGTADTTDLAVSVVGDGGTVGVVGVPHGVRTAPVAAMFRHNIGIRYGIAPARRYLPELLDSITGGSLDASFLVDRHLELRDAAKGYAEMAERTTLKAVLWPQG
ncbi:alcohol dehydrogenase catalytic domain-containing protein [Catenulispora pinisilvae]|uniref:alcohol dehydrogenase catalytic domain-containing protein n=1 Tax=Catenulispora pinisilvae TaxID=2705253 RepID=UPI001891D2E1|nr:alcohol dehydrogenase catalytic domain-containing protein [Catenulispora pinisilvae]